MDEKDLEAVILCIRRIAALRPQLDAVALLRLVADILSA